MDPFMDPFILFSSMESTLYYRCIIYNIYIYSLIRGGTSIEFNMAMTEERQFDDRVADHLFVLGSMICLEFLRVYKCIIPGTLQRSIEASPKDSS